MQSVRFHGRGGHGVKTASRILGTAAFRAGLEVQDCPVFGAERRGAAVAAYTRVDDVPLRERGRIERPDIIVVGDATLLGESSAAVLEGLDSASSVFVNTAAGSPLPELDGTAVEVQTLDLTALALEICGRGRAISAALGAAAARLVGRVSREQLRGAVREELGEADVGEEMIEKNVRLAEHVFDSLSCATRRQASRRSKAKLASIGYDGAILGSPTIVAPGNSSSRQTGAWRLERPELDRDLCTRCGICFVRCPDGTILLDESGYPIFDYEHCKGCMICRQQCPLRAISGVKEVRAW